MQKPPRLALGYRMRDGRWEDITYTRENNIYGEDVIFSKVVDLYKVVTQALYTNRLVSRPMIELAFTPGRTNDGKAIRTDLLFWPSSYGFGWFISSLDGSKVVEHSGGWAGYVTEILRVPSRRITAIVLSELLKSGTCPASQRQMIEIAEK